jgi:hypothetical protein
MNLGGTYMLTFFLLCGATFVIALLVAVLIERKSRRHMLGCLAFPFLFLPAVVVLTTYFQQTAFERLHQWRNHAVPYEFACLEYRPTIMDLHARYQMTLEEFSEWIADYPMRLSPMASAYYHDEETWNIKFTGPMFETKRADNGKQLRVYYQDGVAYVSYNAW